MADVMTPEPMYGSYQVQGYQARDFGAKILVQQGASVSSEYGGENKKYRGDERRERRNC